MFIEHFQRARDNLNQRGLRARVEMGSPVSEGDLKAVDAETDFPMPTELRQFYLEVGDGFTFIPDDSETSDLVGWERMSLDDHKTFNSGFAGAIEEEAMRELGKRSSRTDPELLKQQLERRMRWMPFYGFLGDGNVLCLDLSVNLPVIRFYEALVWTSAPQTWDFMLAASFTEFVERWSQYQFLSPAGAWTSFCTGDHFGRFDWAPEHFPQSKAAR